jgi:uncharacterized phage infection (PIP) family protein YhgE
MEVFNLIELINSSGISGNLLYSLILFVLLYLIASKLFVRYDKYNLKIMEMNNDIHNIQTQTISRVNRVEHQVEKIEALVKEVAHTVNNQHKMINDALQNIRTEHNEALKNIRDEYKQINTRLSHLEGKIQ